MWLERALLFVLIIHVVAMVSMVLFLLPGLSGGTSANEMERISYIANHVWYWRLGWFPWQLSALSNLLLCIILVTARWISKPVAVASLLSSIVAVCFEQPGEFWWITRGVDLARSAIATGNAELYLAAEQTIFSRVSAWAPIFYTLSAVCWSICFARAQVWNRFLTYLSIVLWSLMFAVSAALLLPPAVRPSPQAISSGNALGFILLTVWTVIVTELVMRRSRPFTKYGRYAWWHHPVTLSVPRPLCWLVDQVANSRLVHELCAWLPQPVLVSDITDVVYINYLVEAERLFALVPWGLELQKIGPESNLALFTFLTYNHGHFGPRIFGPLRRLLPSPVQSNWRIHVFDPRTGKNGIHFLTTAMGNTLLALVARSLSDGIAMHVPKECHVNEQGDSQIEVLLEPGTGTAPDVKATLADSDVYELPSLWQHCFAGYQEFLAYCVPQDRAMTSQPWLKRVMSQEINLGIPLQDCQPLKGNVVSQAATEIIGDAAPVCFRVDRVNFVFARTTYDAAS